MKRNSFYVMQYINKDTGKEYAMAQAIHNSMNLVGMFPDHTKGGFTLLSLNACDTWKEAQEIAGAWNTISQDKGVFAF